MRVLILCAGEGTRLRPLTEIIAKPAVPLLNLPLWAYPLQLIESLDPSEVHVNLHHLPETVKSSFKRHGNLPYFLEFHFEESLLGSAGPLMHLKNSPSRANEHILLVNGDGVVLTKDADVLRRMKHFHDQSKALATILALPLEGAGVRFSGVWHDPGFHLTGVGTSAPGENSKPLHYASMMLLSERVFDFINQDSWNIFTDVLLPAGRKGELVQVFRSDDLKFYETGNLKDLAYCHKDLMEILSQNHCEWNLIDVLDRFQPGWRNYQKKEVYRSTVYSHLKLENPNRNLVLISKDCKNPSAAVKMKVLGPSTLYEFENNYPDVVDGIYWGFIKKALLNDGTLIDL